MSEFNKILQRFAFDEHTPANASFRAGVFDRFFSFDNRTTELGKAAGEHGYRQGWEALDNAAKTDALQPTQNPVNDSHANTNNQN